MQYRPPIASATMPANAVSRPMMGNRLIAAALMQPQPPLCIWNIGRSSLMAIIRGEPALRRHAKRAFPRVTFTYSLFMLGL